MEQQTIDLIGTSSDSIYKEILNIVSNALFEKFEVDTEDITLEKKETYYVIQFFGKTAIRIIERNKQLYISFPERYAANIDASAIERVKSEHPWIRLPINKATDAFDLEEVFCAIYENEMPNTFDCCSRYMQCSDELKCVQPIPELMRECKYRKKLLRGVVFFGKNRNV